MFDSLLIIPHEAETLRKRKKDRQRRERDVFVYLLLRGIYITFIIPHLQEKGKYLSKYF